MQHVKHYNDIRVTYNRLIKKMINYANTTDQYKSITVSTHNSFIRIKDNRISIKPYSNGSIQLRMYFDRTLASSQIGEILVHDGENIQRLIFQFHIE